MKRSVKTRLRKESEKAARARIRAEYERKTGRAVGATTPGPLPCLLKVRPYKPVPTKRVERLKFLRRAS